MSATPQPAIPTDTIARQGMFWVTRNRQGEVVAFRPTEESGHSTGPAKWTPQEREAL